MLPLCLVIDTNVLVSAAIKSAGLQRTVFLIAISKPARLYVSHPIFEEYSEVLAHPELRIRKGLRRQLLQLIKNHRHTVVPARRRLSPSRNIGAAGAYTPFLVLADTYLSHALG
jgi:putative PIN family toxin of toxin-antitoxin system